MTKAWRIAILGQICFVYVAEELRHRLKNIQYEGYLASCRRRFEHDWHILELWAPSGISLLASKWFSQLVLQALQWSRFLQHKWSWCFDSKSTGLMQTCTWIYCIRELVTGYTTDVKAFFVNFGWPLHIYSLKTKAGLCLCCRSNNHFRFDRFLQTTKTGLQTSWSEQSSIVLCAYDHSQTNQCYLKSTIPKSSPTQAVLRL